MPESLISERMLLKIDDVVDALLCPYGVFAIRVSLDDGAKGLDAVLRTCLFQCGNKRGQGAWRGGAYDGRWCRVSIWSREELV
jgi:hypothetical protein